MNYPQQEQYLKLVRMGPGFLGFRAINGDFSEKHFDDIDAAMSLIASHGKQADTWVSMASYSNPGASRSQVNAEGLCALWLDVDAHEGSKYLNVGQVQEALDRFVRETGLPSPSLLNYTGHGIQAIWTFTQLIPRAEWQPVADKLQDLGDRLHLEADPITADAARILRVPGTLNYRNLNRPGICRHL